MRSQSPELTAGLAADRLVRRDYLWIKARNRTTGALEQVGLWSDFGNVSIEMHDGFTGAPVTRVYVGAGGLLEIDDVALIADVSVRSISIGLSQIDETITQVIREHDLKNAPIEIHRGLLDPDSRNLVTEPFVRFIGFVDSPDIETPTENEYGSITLNCVSHSRELTRGNSAVRSDEDQKTRGGNDRFFRWAAVNFTPYWGQDNPK